jgi:hypothetical protein
MEYGIGEKAMDYGLATYRIQRGGGYATYLEQKVGQLL